MFEEKESERTSLCTEQFLDRITLDLKEAYLLDKSHQVQEALKSNFAQNIKEFGSWFQRIEFPEYGISTTSDHELVRAQTDRINSLGGRLSEHEAAVLRPLPKWKYIEPLLPDLEDKTVMEVGSNSGFFSFKFAQAGAKSVTGVEVVRRNWEQANWSARQLGLDSKVKFLNTDIMLDLTLQPHDVVFMSAVHVHFVVVFFGLLRSVNLAKETLIIDAGGPIDGSFGTRLHIDENNDRVSHHAWHLSTQMMMKFLYLVGVESSKVKRFQAPWGNHMLYVIDTSNVETFRETRGYPEYIKSFLELDFKQ